MTPSSSFVTKSRSRMRIVPLSTSSLIAGAIRPVNLLPGEPDDVDVDRADFHVLSFSRASARTLRRVFHPRRVKSRKPVGGARRCDRPTRLRGTRASRGRAGPGRHGPPARRTARPRAARGPRRAPRARARSSQASSTFPGATRTSSPVRRARPSLTRLARAGSTAVFVRGFVRAPDQRAARSAARTDMPCATIFRASRRRSVWSGTASTARAWPSCSSPRSTIASTSSDSSSRRTLFEIAGFDRPTRSDDLAERQLELVEQQRVAARLLDRRRGSRGRRSRRGRAGACRGRPPRGSRRAGSARPPRARRASGARRRSARSRPRAAAAGRPAGRRPRCGSSRRARRSSRGRTGAAAAAGSRGSARPARARARAAEPPPIRTSKPRPSPRRPRRPSAAFDKLHRHLPVGIGAARAPVVVGDRQAVARRLRDAHRARHDRLEDEVPEVAAHLALDVGGEPRPRRRPSSSGRRRSRGAYSGAP